MGIEPRQKLAHSGKFLSVSRVSSSGANLHLKMFPISGNDTSIVFLLFAWRKRKCCEKLQLYRCNYFARSASHHLAWGQEKNNSLSGQHRPEDGNSTRVVANPPYKVVPVIMPTLYRFFKLLGWFVNKTYLRVFLTHAPRE